uniref:G_PROTEIN_RECEP_F1_2 domain-containing protein n=1 Tax=Rhabditophanes sp. KR3021 TaxID=114890 RepID=A0AC35U6Q9_9BILA
MLLALLGVVLNAYVIAKLAQLVYSDYERFKRGCALPIAAMSSADMISLLAIITSVVITGFLPKRTISQFTFKLFCKLDTYLIHSMTSFSTWCWLFVSSFRYMAVYHPLWQSSRWGLGLGSLGGIFVIAIVSNSWLLYSVQDHKNTCVEETMFQLPVLTRVLHVAELIWSYFVPALITLCMDIRVLFTHPPDFIEIMRNDKNKNSHLLFFRTFSNGHDRGTSRAIDDDSRSSCQRKKHIKKARTTVWRWLVITSINQILNLPENLVRLFALLQAPQDIKLEKEYPGIHLIALLCRFLYFTQFCFNASILSIITYRQNVQPKKVLTYAEQCKRNKTFKGEDRHLLPQMRTINQSEATLLNAIIKTDNFETSKLICLKHDV